MTGRVSGVIMCDRKGAEMRSGQDAKDASAWAESGEVAARVRVDVGQLDLEVDGNVTILNAKHLDDLARALSMLAAEVAALPSSDVRGYVEERGLGGGYHDED